MRRKEISAPDRDASVGGGVVAVQDTVRNIGAGGAVDAAIAVVPSRHIGWIATVLKSVSGIELAIGVPWVVRLFGLGSISVRHGRRMPVLSTSLLHVEPIVTRPMLELLRLGGSHLPGLSATGALNGRACERVVPTASMHRVVDR